MVMRLRGALFLLLVGSSPAYSKPEPTPPAPSVAPDWSDVKLQSEAALKRSLFDPSSAQIKWVQGFTWGFYKPVLERRIFGWVACGTINAKNRMGGYVGAQGFTVVFDGTVKRADINEYLACPPSPSSPLQPELEEVSFATNSSSVADEIAKLAELKEKGVLSEDEFRAAKAKLLGTQ